MPSLYGFMMLTVSCDVFATGETRTINLKLKDLNGEPLNGHDSRQTIIKLRMSMHHVSSSRVFADAEKEAVRILAGSDKLLEHLECCMLLGPPHRMYLGLSKFETSIPDNPWREFRVFVKDSAITGIAQRHHMFLAELSSVVTVERFKLAIFNFFYHDVCHEMEEEAFTEYILDIYIAPSDKTSLPEACKIISVKPLDESIDGVLFDWSDPVDRRAIMEGEIMPDGVPQYMAIDDGTVVSNVMIRVVHAPKADPLDILPTLWSDSLKGLHPVDEASSFTFKDASFTFTFIGG